MTDEIEHSPYDALLLTKNGPAFINIYRTKGAFDWTLEIKCNFNKRSKTITWPNSFLSDKTAQDAAKEKIIELGWLPKDFKKVILSASDVENFLRGEETHQEDDAG